MKIFETVLAGCLLLVSSAVFSNAQDDKNPGGKAPRQEEPKPAVNMPDQAQDEKTAKEEGKQSKEQEKQTKQEKKQQDQELKRTEKEQRNDKNDQKAGQDQNRNANANERASGNGRDRHQASQRIPEDKFRSHFGREHHFRVSQPVIVENRPRFQYSGFWFEFIDSWPVGWSYSDDCYIDYIDGEYFLFDVLHPETRIAVIVVFQVHRCYLSRGPERQTSLRATRRWECLNPRHQGLPASSQQKRNCSCLINLPVGTEKTIHAESR